MTARRALLLVLPAVAVLASCGTGPCTACPDLAGNYHLVLSAAPVESSTCLRYFSDGGSFDLTFQQNASQVFSDVPPMTATLRENLSVAFTSFGNRTQEDIPTTNTLTGRFSPVGENWRFSGSMVVVVMDAEKCSLRLPVEGLRDP